MGIKDVIILDGYGRNQDIAWRIETECQSLLITSSVFDLETDVAYLHIEEGKSRTSFTGNSEISHTTNTGDVTISFDSAWSYRECFKI